MMKTMPKQETGMTLIVKTITRLTVGLILLYGVYVVLNGHLSPGGGFAGGVIVALSFIHIMLAYGRDVVMKKLSLSYARAMSALGILIFLSVAAMGFINGPFFTNFFFKNKVPLNLLNEGSIPLYEVGIALVVGGGLFAIFAALVIIPKTDKFQD